MNREKQERRLRELAAGLLSSGKADVVAGIRENEEAGRPTPFFLTDEKQAGGMVWNHNCHLNLAHYLRGLRGKRVAVTAKACDVRSIVMLLGEGQLDREELIIIGVECAGMEQSGRPAPGCAECPKSYPEHFDISVGADGSDAFSDLPMPGDALRVTDWLKESADEERAGRFRREIDKCILCFSCRQACPGCYCEKCFIDRKASPWSRADTDRGTKEAFHLTRAMHLAGRCTACGACERVCPSGVKLGYLFSGLREFISDLYDFRAGEDPQSPSALNLCDPDDREIGFLVGDDL